MSEPTKNRDLATLTALARASGASDVWLLRLGEAMELAYQSYDDNAEILQISESLGESADALLICRFPVMQGEEPSGFYRYDPAFALGDPEMRAVALLHLALRPLSALARKRVIRYALDRLLDWFSPDLEGHPALVSPVLEVTGDTTRLEPPAETEGPRRRGRPAKASSE